MTQSAFYCFEMWIIKHPEVYKQLEEEITPPTECQQCEGSGEHYCECGSRHECHECDGTGKISEKMATEMLEDEIERRARKLYENIKNKEMRLLSEICNP